MRGKVNKSQTIKRNQSSWQQTRQLSNKQALIFLETCNTFLADIIREAKFDSDEQAIQRYMQPSSKLEDRISYQTGRWGVVNKAIFVALGINLSGNKELLGLWLAENEGAKFWLSVLTELKKRGVEDILIACIDGLKGFPEAIESVNSVIRKATTRHKMFPNMRPL